MKLHPRLRCVASSSLREAPENYGRRPSQQGQRFLADNGVPCRQAASLNLQCRLRDCLRLPLHSFTYF